MQIDKQAYMMIRNLISLMTIGIISYSCSVSNRTALKRDYPIILTDQLMAIGDTSIHRNINDSTRKAPLKAFLNSEFGRSVTYRNHAQLANIIRRGAGKIYCKLGVDRKGNVVYTEIDQINTSFTDKKLLAQAMNMFLDYEFEPDSLAPEYQYGMIKIFLDADAFR